MSDDTVKTFDGYEVTTHSYVASVENTTLTTYEIEVEAPDLAAIIENWSELGRCLYDCTRFGLEEWEEPIYDPNTKQQVNHNNPGEDVELSPEIRGTSVRVVHHTHREIDFSVDHSVRYVEDPHSTTFTRIPTQTDRELVLAVVKDDGKALAHASKDLQADREIVLAAVSNNGSSLQYASDDLRADKPVVLAALDNNGEALRYASESLREDREVGLAALAKDGAALPFVSEELRNDKDVVLGALAKHGAPLQSASEELRNDREVVLAALKNNGGGALRYASDKLKDDKEVVLTAVANGVFALRYVSEALKADKDVLEAAIKRDRRMMETHHELKPLLKKYL